MPSIASAEVFISSPKPLPSRLPEHADAIVSTNTSAAGGAAQAATML